eukprot:931774-Prymnesium_polylepis.1
MGWVGRVDQYVGERLARSPRSDQGVRRLATSAAEAAAELGAAALQAGRRLCARAALQGGAASRRRAKDHQHGLRQHRGRVQRAQEQDQEQEPRPQDPTR